MVQLKSNRHVMVRPLGIHMACCSWDAGVMGNATPWKTAELFKEPATNF